MCSRRADNGRSLSEAAPCGGCLKLRALGTGDTGTSKVVPLRADHPGIGQRCILCKRAIRAGDRTGLVPPLDFEEPVLADGLICHWTCIESGLSRLRQGETTAGTTRRFVESWADAFSRKAVAGERRDAYTSEADFILKNGRSFKFAAVQRGFRTGRPSECATPRHFLRKPDMYMYVEGYAVNKWMTMHAAAHAWGIGLDNLVVDPMWDEGIDYFGVQFRHDYLNRVLKARRDYGLIDNS